MPNCFVKNKVFTEKKEGGFNLFQCCMQLAIILSLVTTVEAYIQNVEQEALKQHQHLKLLHYLEDSLHCARAHHGEFCREPELPPGWNREWLQERYTAHCMQLTVYIQPPNQGGKKLTHYFCRSRLSRRMIHHQ